MKKRPPAPPPEDGEDVYEQDTLEVSAITTAQRPRLDEPDPDDKRGQRRSPRPSGEREAPGGPTPGEDSQRWVALIEELTEEERGAAAQTDPEPVDALQETRMARARRFRERHGHPSTTPLADAVDLDTLTTVEDDDKDMPAEWYTSTNPEMELTRRMQDRFVAELRSGLDDPGGSGERDDDSIWTQYPPTSPAWEDAPPTELPDEDENSVTLVSRPLKELRGLFDATDEASPHQALTAISEVGEPEGPRPVVPLPVDQDEVSRARREGIPFGQYWLLRRLKTGGMGEVYMAVGTEVAGVARTVAIKRILLPLTESEDFVNMFIDEAKITVQLSHSAIVQIFELGQVGKQYFIAMEYVHGRDLDTIITNALDLEEEIPLPVAVYIAQQTLEGLDYAHRRRDVRGESLGIVHRDVSPPNILCSYEGQVKLTDFGIAKAAVKVTMTRPGLILGKTGYMSPEQIKSERIDRRSDIFAAGVVLYEMLSGRRLFRAASDAATIRNVILAKIPPIREVRPEVPEDLAEAVHWALQRDAGARPQWASELSERLQRVMLMNGYRKPQRHLVEYMAEHYGGSHPGEPIFKRRG